MVSKIFYFYFFVDTILAKERFHQLCAHVTLVDPLILLTAPINLKELQQDIPDLPKALSEIKFAGTHTAIVEINTNASFSAYLQRMHRGGSGFVQFVPSCRSIGASPSRQIGQVLAKLYLQ